MKEQIIGVIFCIQNQAGLFLLEQRDGNSPIDKWSWVLPGGSIESGETPLQAVLREAEEEFCISIAAELCEEIGRIPTHDGKGLNPKEFLTALPWGFRLGKYENHRFS